jgi:phage gp36-like protein
MAWTTITTDLVKTRLAGAEVTSLQTAALASGQTDPLPEIVTQVVDEVRGYVAAGGYTLGAAATIPSKLISATLAITRFRLATRLPRFPFDDNRRREYEDAIRLLNRVADGKFAVEEPTTTDTETLGAPSPAMTAKTLTMDRTSQDGI